MEWQDSAKYSWNAFPLGPVSNTQQDQTFLWERGLRSLSNLDLNFDGQPPFEKQHMQMPNECAFELPGCQVPPLAHCRQGAPTPHRSSGDLRTPHFFSGAPVKDR